MKSSREMEKTINELEETLANSKQEDLNLQFQYLRHYNQSNIIRTDNALDLTICGLGYFLVKEGDELLLTRAGAFHIDKNENIVTHEGLRLQGYLANEEEMIVKELTSLKVNDKIIVDNVSHYLEQLRVSREGLVEGTYSGLVDRVVIGQLVLGKVLCRYELQLQKNLTYTFDTNRTGDLFLELPNTKNLGFIAQGALEELSHCKPCEGYPANLRPKY